MKVYLSVSLLPGDYAIAPVESLASKHGHYLSALFLPWYVVKPCLLLDTPTQVFV